MKKQKDQEDQDQNQSDSKEILNKINNTKEVNNVKIDLTGLVDINVDIRELKNIQSDNKPILNLFSPRPDRNSKVITKSKKTERNTFKFLKVIVDERDPEVENGTFTNEILNVISGVKKIKRVELILFAIKTSVVYIPFYYNLKKIKDLKIKYLKKLKDIKDQKSIENIKNLKYKENLKRQKSTKELKNNKKIKIEEFYLNFFDFSVNKSIKEFKLNICNNCHVKKIQVSDETKNNFLKINFIIDENIFKNGKTEYIRLLNAC